MKLTHEAYEALSPTDKLKFAASATPEELAAAVRGSMANAQEKIPDFAPYVEPPSMKEFVADIAKNVKVDGKPYFSRGFKISVFSVIILLIGCAMAIDGILASSSESQLSQHDQSAIRGIEYVTEYGLGFVIVALAFILNGIAILIDDNSKRK